MSREVYFDLRSRSLVALVAKLKVATTNHELEMVEACKDEIERRKRAEQPQRERNPDVESVDSKE